METLLKNARLILESGVVEAGALLIRNGMIASVSRAPGSVSGLTKDQIIDLEGAYLAPGLIDIHIHGSHGIDIIAAGPGDLSRLAEHLLTEGITGYVPTLVPIPDQLYQKSLSSILAARAAGKEKGHTYSPVLGVHFEGPFVSEKKCGALHKQLFRTYNGGLSSLDLFLGKGTLDKTAGEYGCRLMTLAPEITGGIGLIRDLTNAGVRCFIGHTAADFETLGEALAAGAVHMTHFPNALEPLHHRRPGAVAWGLLTDQVSLDSIIDYHHVHPEVIRLIYRMKGPGRMALISDAIPPTRLPEGVYDVWGDKIAIENGRTRLANTGGPAPSGEGTIAGSVITLRDAVRNAVDIGIPLHEAILMASLVPARAAGIDQQVGSLDEGKLANLTVFDEDLKARLVIVEGETKLDNRS